MHLIGGIILVALSGTLALTFGDALAATQNDSFTLSILESYVSSGKADLHDEYHAIVIPEMSNAVLILPDTPLGELRTRYHYGGDKGAGEQFNSAIRNLTTQNIHQRQSGSTWYVTGYTYTYTCSYTTSYTWSGDWLWNGCVNYVNSGGTLSMMSSMYIDASDDYDSDSICFLSGGECSGNVIGGSIFGGEAFCAEYTDNYSWNFYSCAVF